MSWLAQRPYKPPEGPASAGGIEKLTNLRATVALHVFHYNFCRIHSSLRRTPAMAAGVTERLWSINDLFG